MIDFFYKWYSCTGHNRLLWNLKIDAINRHFCRICANIFMPLYYMATANSKKYSICGSNVNSGFIVTMTSFPPRIHRLWIVIESILHQTVRPEAIYLWLSKEQFPSLEGLPKRLLKLQARGVIICLRDEDLRSHKKYYYVIKEKPETDFVTVDDDILYPTNVLSDLVKFHEKNPKSIVGRYLTFNKISANYSIHRTEVQSEQIGQPSDNFFLGTGGGAYFPSGSLPSVCLDKTAFMSVCRNADDVWLNVLARYNNTPIILIQKECDLLTLIFKKDIALYKDNSYNGGNSVQLQAVRDYCIKLGKDPLKALIK